MGTLGINRDTYTIYIWLQCNCKGSKWWRMSNLLWWPPSWLHISRTTPSNWWCCTFSKWGEEVQWRNTLHFNSTSDYQLLCTILLSSLTGSKFHYQATSQLGRHCINCPYAAASCKPTVLNGYVALWALNELVPAMGSSTLMHAMLWNEWLMSVYYMLV